MAKKITSEDLVLNIIINGDKGRSEIIKLEDSIKKLNDANKAHRNTVQNIEREMNHLKSTNQQNSTRYKELSRSLEEWDAVIKKNNNSIDIAQNRLKDLRSGLDLSKKTYSDLRAEHNRLTKLLRGTIPGTEQWKKFQSELLAVDNRMKQINLTGQATKVSLGTMFKTLSHAVVGLAGTFMIAIRPLMRFVERFANYTDVLADARKTTGLTQEEIEKLSDVLSTLNTRTSQNDLMGLVRIAGKLGTEGAANIEGFTRAADQLVVALKEDLGGDAEEAIRTVGKIVDIFGLKDSLGIEKAMLSVGSAINELGASSTANEGYIVEFTNRVAGVAPLVKVSAENIMGLAATLDQFGQTAEVSSTVYSQLMIRMFQDTPTYARLAGLEIKEFNRLLNEDANEAFIRVLEGVKGNDDGIRSLVSALGEMGLQGKRVAGVLGVLSKNTGVLRDQQKLSNEAFSQATSLTEEFNIKNNNAQAQLEKNKKVFTLAAITLGQQLTPVLMKGYSLLTGIMQMLVTVVSFLSKHIVVLSQAAAAIVAYNIVVNKTIILEKLRVFWNDKVIASLKRMYATMLKNPNAAVIALAVLLLAKLAEMALRTDNVTKAMRRARQAMRDFEIQAATERMAIDRLFGTLKGAKEGTQQYKAAKQEIIDQYGEYLSGMDTEIATLQDIEGAQKAVTAAVMATGRARALANASRKAEEKYAGIEVDNLTKIRNLFVQKSGTDKGSEMFARLRDELFSGEGLSEDLQAYVDSFATLRGGLATDRNAGTEINSVDNFLANIQNAKSLLDTELQELNAIMGRTQAEIEAEQTRALEQRRRAEERAAEERKKALDKQMEEEESVVSDSQQKALQSILERGKDEKALFEDRLKEAGLYGKKKKDMTSDELVAYEILKSEHEAALLKIEQQATEERQKQLTAAIKAELDSLQQKHDLASKAQQLLHLQTQQELQDNYTKGFQALRDKHSQELQESSLSQAKKEALLLAHQDAELAYLKEYQKNREELITLQGEEENTLAIEQAKERLLAIKNILRENTLSVSFDLEGLDDKQVAELEKQVAELEVLLSKLGLVQGEASLTPTEGEKPDLSTKARRSRLDVLGMRPEDWDALIGNLEKGKLGIEDLQTAAAGLTSIWGAYNDLMAAQSKKRIAEAEHESESKKKTLDKQLQSGIISRQDYDNRVSKLNEELDRKKEAIEKAQAKREKALAIFSAIINTAAGVSAALKVTPPAGYILAGITAALGGVQVATIASTQYAKGKYPILGGEDGKLYNADYVPVLETGIYDRPSVGLFSEKAPEIVVDGATSRKIMMKYPQVYRNIIEISRGRTPQYNEGRYPAPAPKEDTTQYYDDEMKQLLRVCIQTLQDLQGMELYVSMYGKNGLMKALKKAERYEKIIKK